MVKAIELPHVQLSIEDIEAHWLLIQRLVNGGDALPSATDNDFWAFPIKAYKAFLQALGKHPDVKDVHPPRVLRACWIAHLLQPKQYQEDTFRLARRTIPHHL